MNIKRTTASRGANTPAAKLSTFHYQSANYKAQGQFNKSKLPYPIAVLSLLGIRPSKANRGGYWIIRCPFHKNGKEKKPSLNLHQVDGYFRCHACGERGDLLKFYMQVTGKAFVEAVKALGAWEYRA